MTLSATNRYPLPSFLWKAGELPRTKLARRLLARLGFLMLNSGWVESAATRSTASGTRARACTANHLSSTSASPAASTKKVSMAPSRATSTGLDARQPSAESFSVMHVAPLNCCSARSAASVSLRAQMKERATLRRRRTPTASAVTEKPAPGAGARPSCSAFHCGRSAAARERFTKPTDAATASGSITSSSCSSVDSSGSSSAYAATEGSVSPRSAASRRVRYAATYASGRASSSAGPPLDARDTRRRWLSCWPAFQRLNESVSWAMRKASSSSLWSKRSRTGAEKSRSTEATGRSLTPWNTKACSLFLSSSTVDCITSVPSGPRSPTTTGMWKGSLWGCPGVAGVLCFMRSVKACRASSYSCCTSSTGVPAWRYQRSNCVRSTPLASDMAARKSSHVTAWPSWRSK
mmetsp:Transcript_8512/g.28983  ORF Transcript_8512/g.28983 Transcript_8512/m.28983 type:complete len:407 (-) Transcript_8512:1268-2488(-)